MSDDPMRGLLGEAPDPFNFEFGLGGLAAYGGGSADAFNREALTGAIDSAIQQGLQGLPTAASALADQTTEKEYIEGLLSNLDPETEANIREELSDFLESQETEDFSTGLENELEGGMLDTGAGDESIVTDDPQAQWEEVDKDSDFDVILGEAMRIFGAYNRDAIKNVVDVVNDRNMSVGEVATATGNTVESINQAAAESGAAIENQGLGDTVTDGAVTDDTVVDNTTVGGGNNQVVLVGDDTVPQVPEGEPTVVMDTPVTPEVVMDTPVTPRPITPRILPELPKKPSITLIQNILNEAPITESILFPTEFTKLENVQQGMFGQFLSAAGGNNDIS